MLKCPCRYVEKIAAGIIIVGEATQLTELRDDLMDVRLTGDGPENEPNRIAARIRAGVGAHVVHRTARSYREICQAAVLSQIRYIVAAPEGNFRVPVVTGDR